jgi:hypothetical protein
MKKNSILLSACIVGLLCFGNANAALEDRGAGLVYDTELDITWLADGNYAQTSGYHATGIMSWGEANSWASQVQYAGHSGWRLPYTPAFDPTCSDHGRIVGGTETSWGYGCTGSELGHLYHVDFSTTPGDSIFDANDPDLDLFVNLMADASVGPPEEYWSSLTDNSSRAFHLHLFNGFQRDIDVTQHLMYALLVHDGDISPVPLPAALWLFTAGLVGLYGVGRQKQHQLG